MGSERGLIGMPIASFVDAIGRRKGMKNNRTIRPRKKNLTFEPMPHTLTRTYIAVLIQESLVHFFSRLAHSVLLLQAWSAECVLLF